MRWGALLGVSVMIFLLILFGSPGINKKQKKEKIAYITLFVIGWLLACMLILFPDTPGPTQVVDRMLKPLGKLLEE
jgi:multisubunit Na+/H+ antiporter MnhB subunit